MYVLFVLAPCLASDVSADVDCSNNSARVSWSSGRGADSYVVTVAGGHGSLFSCESEEDWCDLTELSCGQLYHVSLTTISSNCNTETRTNVTFSTRKFCRSSLNESELCESDTTIKRFWVFFSLIQHNVLSGPCDPQRVRADLECGTNTATMHWEEVDVEFYTATATSKMGTSLWCNSTNSTCQFSNLQCGETYMLSVASYSNMCYSEVSSAVEVQTG